MTHRAPPDVRLRDLPHFDGGHHPGGNALLFESVLERQRIDDRRQHAHVVRRDTVHGFGGGGHAPEEIAAPHHHAYLDAGLRHLGDLAGEAAHFLRIDPETALAS